MNASPSLPLEDAFLRVDGPAITYLRTIDIGGKTSSFDVYLPYFCVSGSAVLDGERQNRSICGQGDTKIRISYNLIGARAMELSEFERKQKKTVIGVSLQASLPTGRYDDDKLLNIGANRWFIKPEIGISIPWGKWSLELAAGLRVFFDNNYFFGGATYLDSVPLENRQENARLGLTWVVALNGKNALKFFAHTGVVTGIGNDSDSYRVAWIYRWD